MSLQKVCFCVFHFDGSICRGGEEDSLCLCQKRFHSKNPSRVSSKRPVIYAYCYALYNIYRVIHLKVYILKNIFRITYSMDFFFPEKYFFFLPKIVTTKWTLWNELPCNRYIIKRNIILVDVSFRPVASVYNNHHKAIPMVLFILNVHF